MSECPRTRCQCRDGLDHSQAPRLTHALCTILVARRIPLSALILSQAPRIDIGGELGLHVTRLARTSTNSGELEI